MAIAPVRSDHHFPAMTGLRAVAAYLVYLHHTNPFSEARFGNFVHQFVHQFHIGVSIFFVLSGFLITHRYFSTSSSGKPWLKSYIINRVARVYPMYFILTTVTMMVFYFQHHSDAHPLFTYLMNISFLRGFFDDLKFSLIPQGWSLTVEECFYFLAPLLFIGFRKSKWYLLFHTIVLITFGCLLVVIFSKKNFYGFFNDYPFLFTYTFPGRCAEFMIGAALAIFFSERLTQNLFGFTFTTMGTFLLVIILCAMTFLENTSQYFVYVIIHNFTLPMAVVLLFYGLIRERTWLSSLLSSRLFIVLGKASYSFYLIHVGVIYILVKQYFEDFMITFLVINLLSVIIWYLVEEPLNHWIRSIGRKS